MLERFPGLIVMTALALGVEARVQLDSPATPWLLGAAAAGLALGARCLRGAPGARGAACRRFAAFLVLGYARGGSIPREADPGRRDGAACVTVEGIVDMPPVERAEDRAGARSIVTRFRLAAGGRTLAVACDGSATHVRGGATVVATGRLLPAPGPRNPGDGGGSPDDAIAVSHPRLIRVAGAPAWTSLPAALGRIRQNALDVLRELFPDPHGGFIIAMVLGDRRLLDPETHDALLLTGTFHLLAISGLHVVIVMAIVLRVPVPRRARVPVRIAVLAAFTVLTGGSPPVVRSAVMFALDALAQGAQRSPTPLNTLGWSACLLLGVDPGLLFDPGFQLSFVSVASILTWGRRLARRLGRRPRALRALLEPLCVSVGTSIGTAPIIALYFERVHPLGPVWNLLAGPLTVVPLAGGGLSLALGLIHPAIARPLAWAVERLDAALLFPLAWGSRLPASAVCVPTPPLVAVGASYAVLCLGLWRPARKLVLLAAAGAVLLLAGWERLALGPAELWTFDAGAGDAALLRSPGAAGALLIDAGSRGSGSSAGPILLREVLATGERSLAGVFLTHAHGDHLRGLDGLLAAAGAAELRIPAGFEGTAGGRAAAGAARRRGIPVRTVERGFRWIFPGPEPLEVAVLHPPARGSPLGRGENDASLALRVSRGGSRVLLLGDLEEDGLALLFASGEDLHADVLVAPHHGRSNALWPDLLERVRPRDVIISGTGDGGARELAERIEAAGLRVHATWRRGAVRTCWLEGRGWVPSYWRPGPSR